MEQQEHPPASSGLNNFSYIELRERNLRVKLYDNRKEGVEYEDIIVLLHGCGLTSQSFGAFALSLPKTIRVIAYDFRHHGGTITTDEDPRSYDLSLETLIADGNLLLRTILRPDENFVLCGHSLGGAIATRLALLNSTNCKGLIVLDAVEEVAISSIENGKKSAINRPMKFRTIQDGISYATSPNGPLSQCFFSANISIPDQLVPLSKEEEGFTWRTNLLLTSKFWKEWFVGLSNDFISVTCPKLLILAGVENLDPTLSIGHMQGKFQLVILANVRAGHFVQENAPGQTAATVITFMQRIKIRNASKAGLSAQEVIKLNNALRNQQQKGGKN